jgi:hypothetical protein
MGSFRGFFMRDIFGGRFRWKDYGYVSKGVSIGLYEWLIERMLWRWLVGLITNGALDTIVEDF